LDDYKDEDWAKEHKNIIFETTNEKRSYCVFAALQTKVDSEEEYKYYKRTGKLSEKDFKDFMDEIHKVSLIDIGDYPEKKTQILMLSTCSYHTDNGRFVVLAYRTK
jgi:sortase B